ACGVSRQEVETARQLPTTRALTAWCFETSRQPFHVAAAGLLVGLESQVPGIYKRNLPPLKSKYGFNEHEVEFFAIHIEADHVHALGDVCAHRGGPLSAGKLSGMRLACPWHGWMYDVRTGQCVFPGRGGAVPSYPVHVEDDEVRVEVS